jgi:hypothetical protein
MCIAGDEPGLSGQSRGFLGGNGRGDPDLRIGAHPSLFDTDHTPAGLLLKQQHAARGLDLADHLPTVLGHAILEKCDQRIGFHPSRKGKHTGRQSGGGKNKGIVVIPFQILGEQHIAKIKIHCLGLGWLGRYRGSGCLGALFRFQYLTPGDRQHGYQEHRQHCIPPQTHYPIAHYRLLNGLTFTH